jgi:hypothetical protein
MSGVRLAVWSGPRNISTALMRSWENRPDTRVVDEPLYAYYLDQTGLNHPAREEVIAAGEPDWPVVVEELTAPVEGIYYQKHMTHHLIPQLPRGWIGGLTNLLLIRDPGEVVASYVRSRADVVADDIGLVQQSELYDLLGRDVPVIDSADFLRAPESYLRWLCDYIDVPFTPPTVSGLLTGTTRSWLPPGFSPTVHAPSRSAERRGWPPSKAARTTSVCTRCGWSSCEHGAGRTPLKDQFIVCGIRALSGITPRRPAW